MIHKFSILDVCGIASKTGISAKEKAEKYGVAHFTVEDILGDETIELVVTAVAVDNHDIGIVSEYLPWTNTKGGAMGIELGVYYVTALIDILCSVKEVFGISRINQANRKHNMVKMGNFGEVFQMVADTLTAGTLLFEGGVVARFHMDADSILPEKPYLTIYGTDGILYLSDPNEFGGEVKALLKGNNEPVVLPQRHGLSENSRAAGVAEMAWAMRKGRVSRAGKELSYHCLEALLGIFESSAINVLEKEI